MLTGKEINDLITKKGITKQHLARMLKIHPATISNIIQEKVDYGKPATLERIETYLNNINTDDPQTLTKK